jgi:Guanine nucleotide exchange factor synembryn
MQLEEFVAKAQPLPSPADKLPGDAVTAVYKTLHELFYNGKIHESGQDVSLPLLALRLALRDGADALSSICESAGPQQLWATVAELALLGDRDEDDVAEGDVEAGGAEGEALRCCVNILAAEGTLPFTSGVDVGVRIAGRLRGIVAKGISGWNDGRLFPLCRLATQLWKFCRASSQSSPVSARRETGQWTKLWEDDLSLDLFVSLLEHDDFSHNCPPDVVGEALRMIFCLTCSFGVLSVTPLSETDLDDDEQLVDTLRRVVRICKRVSLGFRSAQQGWRAFFFALLQVFAHSPTGQDSPLPLPGAFDARQFGANILANIPLQIIQEELSSKWLAQLVALVGELLDRGDLEGLQTPMLVLGKIAENDAHATELARLIFPVGVDDALMTIDGPGFADSVADRLRPYLMASNFALKTVVSEALFAICQQDPSLFTRRVGFGSAAGLLAERGILGAVQEAMVRESASARVEEVE